MSIKIPRYLWAVVTLRSSGLKYVSLAGSAGGENCTFSSQKSDKYIIPSCHLPHRLRKLIVLVLVQSIELPLVIYGDDGELALIFESNDGRHD
jgi:hypothetical protein